VLQDADSELLLIDAGELAALTDRQRDIVVRWCAAYSEMDSERARTQAVVELPKVEHAARRWLNFKPSGAGAE